MRHHRLPTIAAVCVAAVLAACSPTTYDSTADTQPREATSTTLPTGTAAELLPLLLAARRRPNLKTTYRHAGRAIPKSAATRIEQLWAAVSPEIEATQPELVPDFEFVIRRCRAAADRNRPADADRAFKNLTTLVQAYLG